MSEDTISNWTIFGTHAVSIDLFKHEDEDGPLYRAYLTFILDNGSNEPADHVTTIETQIISETPYMACIQAANLASGFNDNVLDEVLVHGEDGELAETLSLDAMLKEFRDGQTVKNNSNPALH